ncbi:MAG: GNAT family N-acetyltransferase [Candidatus Acidiferrales bacterium]
MTADALSTEYAVRTLDPLVDQRWTEFLERHPQASVFHTPGWLQALQFTYGYKPVVFTTSKNGELANGVVFCQVQSWLTGKRLVSLPFSDHCQPLADGDDLKIILQVLCDYHKDGNGKYVELRPISDEGFFEATPEFGVEKSFRFHRIDLRADIETIYRGFHDSCVRRKIKKALRENLTFESGNSKELLDRFRHLLLLTRRRHKLPPQPAAWFANLARCLGDRLTIHLLSKEGTPVASILTLSYKKCLVYKYGCSDARFHNLGGMPLLFWNAIQQGKQIGMEVFDLGRSAPDDPGLTAFKGHLGAVDAELRYYRTPAPSHTKKPSQNHMQWARHALAYLPEPVLVGAGNLLYKHLG